MTGSVALAHVRGDGKRPDRVIVLVRPYQLNTISSARAPTSRSRGPSKSARAGYENRERRPTDHRKTRMSAASVMATTDVAHNRARLTHREVTVNSPPAVQLRDR